MLSRMTAPLHHKAKREKMENNKKTSSIFRLAPAMGLAGALFVGAASTPVVADLHPMTDEMLSDVTGQALFLSDKILPNSLAGAGGGGSTTDFTFYRVGLDVLLSFNLNIDKLQLGCGGVNDAINPGVCDIDMDYVRFMGRGAGQTSPDGFPISGVGNPVSSDFKLTRPYIEIAVRNDASKTGREVAGIKIGAQSADGYVGVGSYTGGTNHTGINAISGFLSASIIGYLRFTSGLGNGAACIGPATQNAACNGLSPYIAPAARTTGTRQTRLQTPDLPLENLHGASGLLSLFSGATQYSNLDVDLDYLHGFALNNTNDFFLSMQRQQICYPRYNKTGYAVTANTGWWMNVPSVELHGLDPPTVDLGCPGFLCTGLLAAFGSPGIRVSNPDLGSRPPDNCYGNTLFC